MNNTNKPPADSPSVGDRAANSSSIGAWGAVLPLERPFQESFRIRLRMAVVVSIVLNAVLWRAASGFVRRQVYRNAAPVEITRVVIDKQGRKTVKVVTPKQIKQRVAQAHKEIERRKPVPVHHEPPKQAKAAPKPPPQGAHNKVLLAKADPNAPANPDDHTALEGGNAKTGQAIDKQSEGNGVANPPPKAEAPKPEPVKPAPPPPVKVEAPKPAPPPDPVKVETPKPEPVKVDPPPPPKPKGPSRDAEPDDQVKPEIPDDLKKQTFKSFVRVKVEIAEDGSFTPILRTSSGNPEIDSRVLSALKRWKWKPALKDGVPVKSTQLFKFEFEVE